MKSMDVRDKKRQLKLIEEEQPANDNNAYTEANGKNSRKKQKDRSSKFCYQPGELRIIEADKFSTGTGEPGSDRSDKFVSQPGEMRLIKKNTK